MKKRLQPKFRIQWPAFTTVAWILCGMALFSTLVLDFMNWKKGEKSYIFRTPAPKEKAPPSVISLHELVLESLSSAEIAAENVDIKTDARETFSCRLEMDSDCYRKLERIVEKELKKRSVSIADKKESERKERMEAFWMLAKGEEKLDLIFSWPAAKPEKLEKKSEPPPPAKSVPAGLVALVVDDMGNNMEALDDLISLKESVTISILPYSVYAQETAKLAHDRGLEVMLHLPLESLNGSHSEAATEGLIQSGMSESEIRRLMSEDFDRVPFILGVNNHMGSKVTADSALMRIILEPIKEKGLYFLDSRTSGHSIAFDTARKMGIPAAYRQVFLDADGDGGLIKDRLFELFRSAQKNGRAIGICHPFTETLQTLKENFYLLKSYGLEAVAVSELMNK